MRTHRHTQSHSHTVCAATQDCKTGVQKLHLSSQAEAQLAIETALELRALQTRSTVIDDYAALVEHLGTSLVAER